MGSLRPRGDGSWREGFLLGLRVRIHALIGSSLFPVVFKPAGFIGFHTVKDSWVLAPQMQPKDFLGRDRSPSGPCPRWACSTVFHVCGRGAFEEIALPRRFLGEVDVLATRMEPEDLLGTDRSPSGPCLRWACSTVIHVCRRGAFGEIAPPRRCLGEVDFSATRM